MSDPKPLTRVELSKISKDPRTIKAFEGLFKAVPSQLEVLDTISETANSKASLSLGMSDKALRIANGGNVLLWLSM